MDFILSYVAAHPMVGVVFAGLYIVGEVLGSIPTVRENAVYQTIFTVLGKIKAMLTTPVEPK